MKITTPKTAPAFLQKSIQLLRERGKQYQTGTKIEERSFKSVAICFNAITGKNITSAEVCLLLNLLKKVRQWSQNRYHADSIEDSVTYDALMAEELYKEFHNDDTNIS